MQRRLCLKRFFQFLEKNELGLSQLKPRHFDLFARHVAATVRNLYGQPINKTRVQRHLHELRPFFRYLYDNHQLLIDHTLHLTTIRKPPRKLPFVPSFEQICQLMALPVLAKPNGLRDRALFETAYGCGLRISELVRLNIDDLDFDSGMLLVRHGKGGHLRRVPLGRCAAHYLQLYLRQARPKLTTGIYPELWITSYGRPFALTQSLIQRIERYEEKLPFPISWHTLRRAFATHLLEGGASLRAVQKLLGHASITTTKFYAQVRPTALKRVHRECHPRG